MSEDNITVVAYNYGVTNPRYSSEADVFNDSDGHVVKQNR